MAKRALCSDNFSDAEYSLSSKRFKKSFPSIIATMTKVMDMDGNVLAAIFVDASYMIHCFENTDRDLKVVDIGLSACFNSIDDLNHAKTEFKGLLPLFVSKPNWIVFPNKRSPLYNGEDSVHNSMWQLEWKFMNTAGYVSRVEYLDVSAEEHARQVICTLVASHYADDAHI